MTRILISIVAFNKLDLTRKCVESVWAAVEDCDYDWHLVLHNNASTDGIATYFEKLKGEEVTAFHHSTNTGFQAPTEGSFTLAKELGFDYLVTVNNDAIVPPDFLRKMLAEFERSPTLAIVGCQDACTTLNAEMHGHDGGPLEYVELSCACIDVRKVAKHYDCLFSPRLRFAYCEDAQLSLKMRKLGYTIAAANVTIEHKRGSTSFTVPEALVAAAENRAVMKEMWAHYIKHRTFNHRIVVRRWGALGDVILVTAILPQLWRENPLSEIVVETYFPEVFDRSPYVRFAARSIGRRPDDLVIDLDGAYENSPMRHFVASYARVAGVEVERPYKTELFLGSLFMDDDPWFDGDVIALHTGPTWASKQWSSNNWDNLVERLMEDGWKVILVGAGKIHGIINAHRDYRDRTPTIHQLVLLLKKCRALVCVDSGVLHCAQAVGVPVIALFGITSSKFILTDGSPAIGIDADPVAHPRAGERHRVAGATVIHENGECMASLTVEQVLAGVGKLVKRKVEV